MFTVEYADKGRKTCVFKLTDRLVTEHGYCVTCAIPVSQGNLKRFIELPEDPS